jgi:REP-associated tyrosine transposase
MPENVHPNRKSPRLPEYDYALAGTYFVTICTAQREHLFGKIVADQMIYSPMGKIAAECWQDIPHHFPSVELDLFVIMPNHIHGLVTITEDHVDVGTRYISSSQNTRNNIEAKQRANGVKPQSLGRLLAHIKPQLQGKVGY